MSVHGWVFFVRRWTYRIVRGSGDELAHRAPGLMDPAADDPTSKTEANRRRD